MQIIRDLASYPPDPPPAAVALGVFDGVHLAHRTILDVAVAHAHAGRLRALACTFDRHPMEVLQPDRAPLPITTLEERLALLSETGVDATIVLAFTLKLAAVEPEAFVKDVLLERLRAREVIVGFNHTFGRGARGNAALLQALGERLGFQAHVVPPLVMDGVPVSSSEIRAALAEGDVERAARYLGREYTVTGKVVQGAGRGRTLGFPTANVMTDRQLLVPAGVYACRARVGHAEHSAVVNIGVRPTFGEDRLVVEAHLLDFSGALYGETITLAFVTHLRGERKFPGPDALRQQIERDIAAARQRL